MFVVIETSDYITVEAFLTLHLARDFTDHRCFRACLYEVSQPVTQAAQLYRASLAHALLPHKICVAFNEKAGRPACQDPGCSSRDLGKLWANPWPSSRGPFTKFYGGRKQTSNEENFFFFWNIDEALRKPNYYHWHTSHSRFVNSARSFDMTNGTICFRQENLCAGNWWVLQHLGMKIGHTPPWNHRKKKLPFMYSLWSETKINE